MSPTLFERQLIQSLESATFHLFVESLDEFALVNALALREIQWFGFGGEDFGSANDTDRFASFSVFERDFPNDRHRRFSGLDLRSLFDRMNFDHSSTT